MWRSGATFPCFALAAISDETTQSGCTGWILYTNATDNAEEWIEWKRGEGNALDYTHPEGTAAKLEWLIEAKFKATVSAAGGGQITIDGGEPMDAWSGWFDAGEVHTIMPVAPDGMSFALSPLGLRLSRRDAWRGVGAFLSRPNLI